MKSGLARFGMAIALVLLVPQAFCASVADAVSAYESGHVQTAKQILSTLRDSADPRIKALQARIDTESVAGNAAGGLIQRHRDHGAPVVNEITVAAAADPDAQIQKVELAYSELQAKLGSVGEQRDERDSCLSLEAVQAHVEEERRGAAERAFERANAIAEATERRQQRALERMRAEMETRLTREIRAELDARFQLEVDARVAAILEGRKHPIKLGGTHRTLDPPG